MNSEGNETNQDLYKRDQRKFAEFHKDDPRHQKEDRTTAEIVEIATSLEDGAIIQCKTWIWPHMQLSLTLDNRPDELIHDVSLSISSPTGSYHVAFVLAPHVEGVKSRKLDGSWRNPTDINIEDIAESFDLREDNIENPNHLTPGTWSGWFLYAYRGPGSTTSVHSTPPKIWSQD